MKSLRIPLHRPSIGPEEERAVAEAIGGGGRLAGDGPIGAKLEARISSDLGAMGSLLVPSGTAALELAMLLLDLREGDEVIMPSYTFSSTANSVVLRGAVPRFAEIDPTTMTMDPLDAARLITTKTRGILPIHYLGIPCDLTALSALARDAHVPLIEDAAQACGASWAGRAVGAWGLMGCFSFHETKSLTCGEGGAVTFSDPSLADRARILREKGTNRAAFFRGEVTSYDWVEVGSSYLLAEPLAAMLTVQWNRGPALRERRRILWNRYTEALSGAARSGRVSLPSIPPLASPSWEGFWIHLRDAESRTQALSYCATRGIGATFHHRPLHAAPMGQRLRSEAMPRTTDLAERLLRLPLYPDLREEEQDEVVAVLLQFLNR